MAGREGEAPRGGLQISCRDKLRSLAADKGMVVGCRQGWDNIILKEILPCGRKQHIDSCGPLGDTGFCPRDLRLSRLPT